MPFRPCFLVADREYASSISSRKLVLETAKFNVITVYSADEAIETLLRFPAVDGAVLDLLTPGMPCADLIAQLKAIKPELLVIAVGAPGAGPCDEADHFLESFEPRRLLELLRDLMPQQVKAIEEREEQLSREFAKHKS